jgi:DNA polymerase-3 subunit alpha
LPTSFVHLRLHTEYSLRDSVVRVPELMAAVRAGGMPAVALTDLGNLFAGLKFYRAALEQGVQPIIGADLRVRTEDDRNGPLLLPLLCQDLQGYRNLSRLISRAWLEGQVRGEALIAREWLTSDSTRGLIALSGAQSGEVGRLLGLGKPAAARDAAERWQELFGDRFYLEVQRLGRSGEEPLLHATVELAQSLALPVVATNDVRFLRADDFSAHEARVCIAERTLLAEPGRVRRYTAQQYLRSATEMQLLFADLPEALANSVAIAQRCALTLALGKAQLPQFPVPAGSSTEEFLRSEAARGLGTRGLQEPAYQQRLASELDVICTMGFAGYFLIVADFIRWSRNNGVPVGPGRGSGAGSLVAYALGITDIDPLRYDLLFERFLNPERVSMPDFDVDFCMAGRDRVIDYVSHKYGSERVSQIITYGTMAARAVVRDTGRVLGQPFPLVDRIAKLVPFDVDMTLDKAMEQEPELRKLYDGDEEVKALLDLARALEGLTRNAGKHAGGVVIAPSVLTDFAPLYSEEGGVNVVTQFDWKDVEAAGLVKFDFLGLRTLTIIDWALRTINAERAARAEPPVELGQQALEDAATFSLLQSARTTAIFQLESRGMKDLIRKLQPDCFEDVIALVALFRPGPLQSGMVDDFIVRKRASRQPGEAAAIDYLHPDLKPVLQPTYGVILYQEQVMQIAQVLAGYTLGGADLLRRAMGKKSEQEMAQQRGIFIAGATARGVPQRQAAHIFDLMEKFAGYGFNKSHSAAYAVLSCQTAWLKAHYPAAFMAAVMSADMDHTEKVVTLINDCAAGGLSVLPPDINYSQHMFTVADATSIRYGLGAVKGVGQAAVDTIVAERTAHGPYASLADLAHRVDLQRVNKRVLEALIRCGSMDALGPNRATLWAELADAMRSGEQRTRSSEAGQNDMFGLGGAAADGAAAALQLARSLPEWNESLRLAGERDTLGLYLTGHPIARCERDLKFLVTGRITDYADEDPPVGEIRWSDRRTVTIAGLIMEVIKRGTRVSCLLDDRTGRIEVAFSEENFQRFRSCIERDTLVLVEGGLRFDEFSNAWRVQARNVQLLDEVRERQARTLVLDWPAGESGAEAARQARLAALLKRWAGGQCTVALRYRNSAAAGTLLLGPDWCVRPALELLENLESLCGAGSVRLSYALPAESAPATRAAAV